MCCDVLFLLKLLSIICSFYSQIVVEEQTSCSICKEVQRDLVPFICGHRSCKRCVTLGMDQLDLLTDSSCPDCREKFLKATLKDTGKDTEVYTFQFSVFVKHQFTTQVVPYLTWFSLIMQILQLILLITHHQVHFIIQVCHKIKSIISYCVS